jgi:ABC-type glycerol-3-phosphate transport system substrate-binding protein
MPRLTLIIATLVGLSLTAWVFWPDAAPRDGRVHIRYWEKWTGFEGDAMREVVNAFNARQSRIQVDFLSVSQVDQKMLLATAGGDPPDVAGLWEVNVHVFADYNALTPLDDRARSAGLTPDHYLPAYYDLCVHRGRLWALPSTPASSGLHWNKQLFRAAGLDPERPPRTFSELDAMAEKLTRRDAQGQILQSGFLPAEPGWWNWAWGCWYGGRLWDGRARITSDSPENVRAFQWVQSYARNYGSKDLQLFQAGFGNFSSPQNAFIDGKVAMVLQGVWMYNYIDKYHPSLEWGAAPFPYPDDRPDLARSTPVGTDVLAIPRGAKHPNEAWEFVRFVQSQEGMEMLCLGQRKHSPLAQVSGSFYRQHPNPYIRLFYDLAREKNTFAPPKLGIWKEFQDEMNAAFEDVWTNGADPAAALGTVRRRLQPKLDRYLEQFGSARA